MRALLTSEQHIVLDADHRIAACSLESFGLLGLKPQVLAAATERPRIADWVTEWSAVQAALAAEAGTTMLVIPPRDFSGETGAEAVSEGVWIHAHLQPIALPNETTVFVLHWHHMPTDAYTLGVAAARRRNSVNAGPAAVAAVAEAPFEQLKPATSLAIGGTASEGASQAPIADANLQAIAPQEQSRRRSALPFGLESSAATDHVAPDPMMEPPGFVQRADPLSAPHGISAVAQSSAAVAVCSNDLVTDTALSAPLILGERAAALQSRRRSTLLEPMAAARPSLVDVSLNPAGVKTLVPLSRIVVSPGRGMLDDVGESPGRDAGGNGGNLPPATSVAMPEPEMTTTGEGVGRVRSSEKHEPQRRKAVPRESVGDGNASLSSSAMGSNKRQERVRRVLAAGSGQLLPSLRLLRRVAVLIVLLSVALSIVMTVVSVAGTNAELYLSTQTLPRMCSSSTHHLARTPRRLMTLRRPTRRILRC